MRVNYSQFLPYFILDQLAGRAKSMTYQPVIGQGCWSIFIKDCRISSKQLYLSSSEVVSCRGPQKTGRETTLDLWRRATESSFILLRQKVSFFLRIFLVTRSWSWSSCIIVVWRASPCQLLGLSFYSTGSSVEKGCRASQKHRLRLSVSNSMKIYLYLSSKR